MDSLPEMKKAIINFVRDEYAEEDQDINESTRLISGGLVGSFSLVSLKRFLEKKYSITIPNEKATPAVFDTIDGICALVQECSR